MRTRSYLVREEHIPERAAFPVIDAHNHLWGNWTGVDNLVAMLDQVDVVCYCDLTANVAISWVEGGYRLSRGSFEGFLASCVQRRPGRFYGFTTATLAQPESEPLFTDAGQFVSETIALLRKHVALGARGLKVLKELGLHYRDGDGNLVAVDDPRLAPIWEEAGSLGIPVLIHQSDPAAFFDPITPDNEHYDTLTKYPSWSFADPKFPRKAELMQRRDNLIRSHRNTTFILAHVANYPEDLSYVARLLDENPNAHIDFSARLDELGRQPYAAREFMIRYQDRICFGTDMPVTLPMYRCYFRFLETFDEFFYAPDYDGTFERHRWPIYGLGLPDEVLRKIYYENALRLVPGLRELSKIGLNQA
jgi:hypothetical protein